MIRANKIAVPVAAVVLAFAVAARAADTKAAVAEIEAHDKAFLGAYEKGETKKMKSEIAKAVSLGEKSGLGADPVMADTYVLAAILEVDGNENAKGGVRDFVKALKIRRDVAIPKGMATSPVKAAFKEARAELGETPKEAATPAATPAAPAAAPVVATAVAPAEAPKTAAEPKPVDAQTDKQAKQNEKQAREDRERQEKQEAQQKELALKEKAASDKQLADAKTHAQQLEQQVQKDKADRDKQLADAKARILQLEQQAQKDRADRDKQLADAKARILQLEQQAQKDKADRDKQLADARAQNAKDREALEKIARDRQAAEAQAKDAENKKKQAQQERERLFAGPEMPARLREALTCAVPDEAPLRTDLFVHCVARPNLKARSIVFYYRAGSARYTSVPMERTAKGWYAALVPGVRVTGKVLQYYAEALDGREAVVANNGKETSPNILTLHAGGPRS